MDSLQIYRFQDRLPVLSYQKIYGHQNDPAYESASENQGVRLLDFGVGVPNGAKLRGSNTITISAA